MKITLNHRAGEHERFAPDAFASQVGKTVPLKMGDLAEIGECRIASAEVSADGKTVHLTYELPENLVAFQVGVGTSGEVRAESTFTAPHSGPYQFSGAEGTKPLCPPCWGTGSDVVMVPGEDGRLVCPACSKPYPPDEALDAALDECPAQDR